MNICVVGTGYVGLVTGTCFADMGNNVWCVDVDEKKISDLKDGKIPIFEPGLEEMVKRNQQLGLLKFTTEIKEGLDDSLFVFIAVGTPPGEDGSADLKYVLQVARDVATYMDSYKIIIDKSTVPVGTGGKVRAEVQKVLSERDVKLEFDIVSNPEFLKEGDAINDFMRPDRIVIGTDNIRTAELMQELYSSFTRNGHPVITMDIASAELTKYAANAMLASRISFMNEISRLCEVTGADVENVRQGIGTDKRIGMPFLYAGLGYGGSCFPKDVQALARIFKEFDVESYMMDAIEAVNYGQKKRLVTKMKAYYAQKGESLSGKKFAMWGLAFKPNTDDMREAPSIETVNALREEGAYIVAYDPVAKENARQILGDESIEYVDHYYDALEGADALLLVTEWHYFRKPDFSKIKSLLKRPLVFDGRNQYEPQKMKERGFEYFTIGRKELV